MSRLIIFVVLLMNSPYLFSQQVRVVSFKTLETLIRQANDTTYIVNFFASWCAPCVKELPEFVQFSEEHATEKVKVIFVSLDFVKDYKKKLTPLSKKLNLPPVYLLDEPNANNWINRLDKNWGGDIPATLFVNSQKQISKLFAQSFTKEVLFKTLKSIAQ